MFALTEDSSFITKYEYGQMLYENPRGIGCIKCHGKNGRGEIIASYKDRKDDKLITKTIIAPDITKISLNDFKNVLNVKRSESLVMPTYFLTDEEIESIHYYISNKDNK
ncbi:cytochrome c [Arcobacter sp. FWKO B]|nr:cytochrome c [Arcobacter sp. FWKO B]